MESAEAESEWEEERRSRAMAIPMRITTDPTPPHNCFPYFTCDALSALSRAMKGMKNGKQS
jgi:hypothetical protein